MTRSPEPTGLSLVDGLVVMERPTIEDYCLASAEYIRNATELGPKKGKAAQIRLSNALAQVTLADLRDRGSPLDRAVAGERNVGGGLRSVKADVSETSEIHGLTLAVEIKPVHLAVGRAIWNRFGDVRTFAVNKLTLGVKPFTTKTVKPFIFAKIYFTRIIYLLQYIFYHCDMSRVCGAYKTIVSNIEFRTEVFKKTAYFIYVCPGAKIFIVCSTNNLVAMLVSTGKKESLSIAH